MNKYSKVIGKDWDLIRAHIKSKIGKEYSVNYLRQVIKGNEKNKILVPVLVEMELMEGSK
jgi:hypothetical protein